MTSPSPLPLAASRFLVNVGRVLTTLLATILFVLAILLAFAWPQLLWNAIESGTEFRVADSQPWISIVLFGAGIMVGLAARMFNRLSMILASVGSGDPFTIDNSRRLRHIGWLMIFMQIASWLTSVAGQQLPPDQNISADFDVSFSGLLAAFLAFVVAQLFEQARGYRDDLEGTV